MRLAQLLERIAVALEQQTEALHLVHESQLQLLDELTAGNGGDEPDEPDTFLDGSPH